MIFIRLSGGLGNQIFQFAAGLLIAKKNNSTKILIDDSSLQKYKTCRNNELFNFFDFKKLDIEVEFGHRKILKYRIPKLLPLNLSYYPFISDKNFNIMLNKLNQKYIVMDGYFQNCLTNNDFYKEIEILKNLITFNLFDNMDDCIIHIRGGDFVKLGWNNITPKEYYIKAVDIMKNLYKQNKFYIVTDDKDYSKNILEKLNIDYQFIGNNMYEDFKLIASFKYRILSSSTFALWASALGTNIDSVVIAPKFWTPNNERKILLPNEMRIMF